MSFFHFSFTLLNRCGGGHNTEKADTLSTFFTSVLTEKNCLRQIQVPKTHWKFGTKKTDPLRKIRLHSLFCGCNHSWKMQCSFLTIGLFIGILSQQQQDTEVCYRNDLFLFSCSLLDNPDMNHQFPTLPTKSGYWETVPTCALSVRKRSSSTKSQYELTVSVIMESLQQLRVFFFLLLSPFISQ